MAGGSNYLENAIIDHVFRGTAMAVPTNIYLSLHTEDPTDAGTGTEVSGGSYARQQVTFVAPTDGVTNNATTITFPTPTGTWGAVSHFGLWDAVSGGNLITHGSLKEVKSIGISDTVRWGVGELVVTVS